MARPDWIVGFAVGVIALGAAGSGVAAAAPGTRRPDFETERRRVLARMDEAAAERQRCRTRFKQAAQVRECEHEQTKRFREWNERYLELLRE
jgi:hypothetical protein